MHWKLKRELSTAISNKWLDKIYDIGLKSGAIGGNLMGAGGGGYFLFVCYDKESKMGLCKTLAKNGLDPTDMRFEMQGSSLIRIS
jgi:D-glycero-alpha-D-manno-heptose-7-phosphate kinase